MEQETTLRQVLLRSLAYANGKWIGELELIIHHRACDAIGVVPFMYDRTWHLHAFKYPHGLDDAARETIKKAFHEQFKTFGSFTEEHVFQQREVHGAKPKIASFELEEQLSEKEGIYAQFKLENIRDTFFITIQLINNLWHYKLHSKQQALETYKTFYTWEDAVFEQVIEEINKNKQYRLKFVVHAKKFKFK